MDSLEIIQGINEAIKILQKANRQTAAGAPSIWKLVEHAEGHLDKQIAEFLAPPAEWCFTCDRPENDCGCVENGGNY
jgi:hypothetical protein